MPGAGSKCLAGPMGDTSTQIAYLSDGHTFLIENMLKLARVR